MYVQSMKFYSPSKTANLYPEDVKHKCYLLEILFEPNSISFLPGACAPIIIFISGSHSPCAFRI